MKNLVRYIFLIEDVTRRLNKAILEWTAYRKMKFSQVGSFQEEMLQASRKANVSELA